MEGFNLYTATKHIFSMFPVCVLRLEILSICVKGSLIIVKKVFPICKSKHSPKNQMFYNRADTYNLSFELWGLFKVLGGIGPVSDDKWGDKFSLIIDEDHEECREEMYRYGWV